MMLLAIGQVPYLHRDLTLFAITIGVITLIAAGLAVGVARIDKGSAWRQAWLLTASLCLLLAVDEAVPLSEWLPRVTGTRWWLIYAIPLGLGLRGWVRAIPLLVRRLPLRSAPVEFLLCGALSWILAFGSRGLTYVIQHHGGSTSISHSFLILEAIFKAGGAALCAYALAQILVQLRASEQPLG